jgi:glycosyltransferase involved in cell wall biosynthesis
MPSLHEGYGLPCVEAMRAGVPVAASDRGALPETCGGAALHFDPEDPAAITAAVVTVAEDEAVRERLRAAGLEHVRGLTWERAAQAVDDVLTAVVSE